MTLDLRGARYIKPAKDKMMRHHDTNHGVRSYVATRVTYDSYQEMLAGRDERFL